MAIMFIDLLVLKTDLGLVFARISRVSSFLPREKATVLPWLKKPEARVFSTILG